MQKYNSREEVPNEYKWDLTDIFKDDNDYNESFEKMVALVDGDCGNSLCGCRNCVVCGCGSGK